VHCATNVAPSALEYLPATQLVHASEPEMLLYLPATHTMHVPPLGPVYPTMQLHMEMSELPASDREFEGHVWHVVSLEAPMAEEYLFSTHDKQATSAAAPSVAEYLPALQSMHESAPVTDLYFPATHGIHALPV